MSKKILFSVLVLSLMSFSLFKGEKKETERNFIDACESAGIIRTSDERFSIVSQ